MLGDLVLDLLDPTAEALDESLGLGHLLLELLAVELETPPGELDDLPGPDDLGLHPAEPVGGLLHLHREDRVAPVHLREERHPGGGVRGGRGRQQVQDRGATGHVGNAGAFIQLGLQQRCANPLDRHPTRELLDALLGRQDVGLGARDPRGEPVHVFLERSDPLRPNPDLVPRLAQLLLVLLQLVFGRREARERRPGQACQDERGDGSSHDSTGAGRAGFLGARARHLGSSNVRARSHTTRALGPRPRPSAIGPRTAAEHPPSDILVSGRPGPDSTSHGASSMFHHGGVYTPTPMRRLLPRLHGPVRAGAIVLAMAAPLLLVSLTAPLAPAS